VVLARDRLNDWQRGANAEPEKRLVSNIVMMGMGEPLYNFEAVRDGLAVIADGDGLSISKRRITLSTSGVVPNIVRAGAEIGSMLAVSLHAVTDELRDQLVPLNRKYPLRELLEACRNYPGLSNARRITFEYVMLKGVNDSLADAKALVRLLKGIPAKINLIPFNPWPGTTYECSDWEQIEKFSEIIFQRRLFLAGAHATRPRYSCRLRPAQKRDRKTFRPRAPGVARHGRDRLAPTNRAFMTALFRITMMFVGYVWACIAASLVLALGTLAPEWDYFFQFARRAVVAGAVYGDVGGGRDRRAHHFRYRLFADAAHHRHYRRFCAPFGRRLWRYRRRAGAGHGVRAGFFRLSCARRHRTSPANAKFLPQRELPVACLLVVCRPASRFVEVIRRVDAIA